jgi:hypothetical protein
MQGKVGEVKSDLIWVHGRVNLKYLDMDVYGIRRGTER